MRKDFDDWHKLNDEILKEKTNIWKQILVDQCNTIDNRNITHNSTS